MKRIGGVVFFYGAANEKLIHQLKGMLPFQVFAAKFAAEHYGHGMAINWEAGKNEARRRNYVAAMTCNALVIVGRPRFTDSVVTAFRQRGRRIFWWNGTRLTESDAKMIYIPGSKPTEFLTAFTALPKEATFEPEIWTMRREEKFAEIREYLDENPKRERLPIQRPDRHETTEPAWYREALKKNADLWRWADIAVQSVKKTDACEWSARQIRKERNADWKKRVKASGCY